MTRRRRLALALAALAVLAPPVLAAPAMAAPDDASGPRRFRLHTPGSPADARGFDNLRFGLTRFNDPGIAGLFAERGAVALGFDYHLGAGWALGLDTQNLYKDWGAASYFLSVTPIQAKYRARLPLGTEAFTPFATAGAGPTVMGLLGAGVPRLGIGLGATIGLGLMLEEAVSIELTANVGQVSAIPYQGLQLRIGTAFGTLGGLAPPWRHEADRARTGPGGRDAAR